MKHHKHWQQVIAKTALLSLGLPVFFTSAAMANTSNLAGSNLEGHQVPTQKNLPETQSALQTTQAPNVCYRVVAESGLYVREEATIYSEAIAILYYGQPVTIAPGGTEKWTPILTPIRGYVWSDWLIPC